MSSAEQTCPSCGYEWPPKERKISNVAGELVELDQKADDDRRKYWAHLCAVVESRQILGSYAFVKYKEKYGEPPPKYYPRPSGRMLTREEFHEKERKLLDIAIAKHIPKPYIWVHKKLSEEYPREVARERLPGHDIPEEEAG